MSFHLLLILIKITNRATRTKRERLKTQTSVSYSNFSRMKTTKSSLAKKQLQLVHASKAKACAANGTSKVTVSVHAISVKATYLKTI
jgi:hypothetical protein